MTVFMTRFWACLCEFSLLLLLLLVTACSNMSINSAAYVLSAIFICIEYLRIGIFYRRQHRILLISFWIKIAFVIIELALAISFGAMYRSSTQGNAVAIIEWGMLSIFLLKTIPR
jgi:hypothetical protein